MADRLYSLFGSVRARSPLKFGLKKSPFKSVHAGKQSLLTPKKWALSEVKNTIHNKLTPKKGKLEVTTPYVVKTKPKEESVEIYDDDEVIPHSHPEFIDDYTDIHPLGLTKRIEQLEMLYTKCASKLDEDPPISEDSFDINDLEVVVPDSPPPMFCEEEITIPDFGFIAPVPEELDFSF